MIEIKKSELEPVMLTLASFDLKTGEFISGLLKEHTTLGFKRKAQDLHKKTRVFYTQFLEDITLAQKECGEDKEKLEKELRELFDETVKIDAEPLLLAYIDTLISETNYDFSIIKKISI